MRPETGSTVDSRQGSGVPAGEVEDLFRAEALDHHRSSSSRHGEPLRLLPHWIRWTYPVLFAIVGCGLLFLSFSRVHLYASGPSVVRVLGRSDVIATVSGVVDSILVQSGDPVSVGQLLVRLDSVEQEANFERVRKEFEDELVNHLRNLLDPTAIRRLSELRTQLDYVTRLRDRRGLRASRAGMVADIRTQVGEQLLSGQTAVTVRTSAERIRVVAALPGKFRPLLRSGLPAWLELEGYAQDERKALLRRVDAGVIGPKEAARYFGQEIADVLALTGPLVLVDVAVPSDTFTSDGRVYFYHEGMRGRLRVLVRSEATIVALLPELGRLFRSSDG